MKGKEINSPQWMYFAPSKFGGVTVVEKEKDTWEINNNGEFFQGNFKETLDKCCEIVVNNK